MTFDYKFTCCWWWWWFVGLTHTDSYTHACPHSFQHITFPENNSDHLHVRRAGQPINESCALET